MRIGALAATAGPTTKAIRFYEQAGLLSPPPRTAAGYRDYPAETTGRLRFIRDARPPASPWPRSVGYSPSATSAGRPAGMSPT